MGLSLFKHKGLEVQCALCGHHSPLISEVLKVCADCLRKDVESSQTFIWQAHVQSRRGFDLPAEPPCDESGVECTLCANRCRMKQGSLGYCGLRTNHGDKLIHLCGTHTEGKVSWYHDPLPTNCVASWVCPAGSSAGYPEFSFSKGPEHGYTNLAVFYEACTFDCLYCQNWHFREQVSSTRFRTAEELADSVDHRTACICYFGGDPTPQLFHALQASKTARDRNRDRILRICWETNGSMNPTFLKKMVDLSITSGGCMKFDLKAYNENLHKALCGVSNKQTLENFKWVSKRIIKRSDPPLLIASTLLVPGYIDAIEVKSIAQFIASCNPEIPYSLLAFYPHFYMPDLPTTSRKHAEECQQAAIDAGLTRVHIGNLHLLSNDY
jgi:pyruvate formate lyase activating enzyme